ncbi:MAG TPA: 2-isopropylmalate synthase [Vicinamibacterales bacterium]|nr:2-isopropylmalate synthase [Vicinamibacterales bacterium]
MNLNRRNINLIYVWQQRTLAGMGEVRVRIFDTSLRDGEQAPGFSMTAAEKLLVARQLDRLGVDIIEAGFPIASDGDFEAVRTIAGALRRPIIAALARACRSDVERAAAALDAARRPRIHVFLATSDLHLRDKLRIDRDQCLRQATDAVRLARQYVDDVEFSAEDATRSDIDFLCEISEAVVSAGAHTLNLPDTVGYALPEDITDMFARVRRRVGLDVTLSAHCHDDLGMAVANSLAAVQAGARQVECTINGIGERAGNASLEEVVMALQVRRDRLPFHTSIRTAELCVTSRLLSQTVGVPVAPNKAIVGANAFAHEAGIHQDGVLKNPLTYEILRPESVGAPGTRLVVGKHSGTRGVDARCRALGFYLRPDALARVYARLVATADRVKAIEDFHIVDAVAADQSPAPELRPCV